MNARVLRIAYLLKQGVDRITRPVQFGVRIILMQDGKVLLVRHTYMRGWHFPGGAINRMETPLEAAAREAREEAGVELLDAPAFVGIFTSYAHGKSDHIAVYLCRNFRIGRATDRYEIAEARLFAIDDLPPLFSDRWRRLVLKMAAGNV
jgi:8-oxo-dGTP pyrophosphatase MutT (NUDIX family)